tara:strand:- start:43555 stop:44214 length:660 start_codon:yes stop_codon:yes gene_type:complete
MKKNSATAVKTFFDDYASKFYSIYREEQKNIFSRFLDRTLRYSMFQRFEKVGIIIKETDSKNILDVGCGPGWHDILLARSQDVKITGIDVAQNMIDIANSHILNRNLEDKLNFITADIFDYKFDSKYDSVFALGVVEYFEKPEELISIMTNLSSKRVIFSIPVKNHWLTAQRRIRYKLRNCPLWFYDKNEIEHMLKTLGLTSYKIHVIDRDFLVEIITD